MTERWATMMVDQATISVFMVRPLSPDMKVLGLQRGVPACTCSAGEFTP